MKVVKTRISTAIALTIGAGLVPGSQLATAAEGWIEEVLVTAQKREENIMDVPIAMTAMTGEALAAAGIQNIEEMGASVSNMMLLPAQNNSNMDVSIRGLWTSSNDPGLDPGTSVYVDDVLLGRDFSWKTNLMDIERIEVLKGPQGTIFGRNTISGAINITTKKPSEEFEAHGDINIGNYDLRQYRASISGPLIEDTLSATASVVHRKRDGYLDNVLGGTLNYEDSTGGRVSVLFTPNSRLSMDFAVDMTTDDGNSNYVVATLGLGAPPGGADPFDRKVAIDNPGFEERDLWGASARISYELENGYTIKSITAYRDSELNNLTDQDYIPIQGFYTSRDFAQEQFTQEFQLISPASDQFNWVAGLYYLDSEFETSTKLVFQEDVFLLFFGCCAGFEGTSDSVASIDTQSYAAFFNATYDITEQLSLNIGVRYTDEEKDSLIGQLITQPAVLPIMSILGFPAVTPRPESISASEVSPTISLTYAINEDANTYLKWARGFKSGGFIASLIAPVDPGNPDGVGDISFAPETVDNYELGLKWMGFDNRLRLNAAVFYMDYTDMQVQQDTFGNLKRVTNAGEATIKGFEADILVTPSENLELTAGFGYVDATFDKFDGCSGVGTSCAGNTLPQAPEVQASASAQYTQPLSSGLELVFRADVSYQDEAFQDVTNVTVSPFGTPNFELQESYTLVNARLQLRPENQRWGISLWAKNLMDEEFLVNSYDTGGGTLVSQPNTPRSYGVQLSLSL